MRASLRNQIDENGFLPLMKGETKRGLETLQPLPAPSFIRRGKLPGTILVGAQID